MSDGQPPRTRNTEKTPLLTSGGATSAAETSDTDGGGTSAAHGDFLDSSDPHFGGIIAEVRKAISMGIYPERIYQGSSGSYFAKDTTGKIVGIFKPVNEEPYGQLNPKWLKWFQKIFMPCCFGRNCLLKNQGYMSEAGAWLVDSKLGLNIVPKTKIVRLASPSFNYPLKKLYRVRDTLTGEPKDLPLKVGSFQLFVTGFKDAIHWVTRFERDPPPKECMADFQRQFERLVVLDYIIRNTDRGNDNWLVRYDQAHTVDPRTDSTAASASSAAAVAPAPAAAPAAAAAGPTKRNKGKGPATPVKRGGADLNPLDILSDTEEESEERRRNAATAALATDNNDSDRDSVEADGFAVVAPPKTHLAAIDNGLAFPIKHPDSWRAYPYAWAWLPYAKIPFSDDIAGQLLPLLTDEGFVEDLIEDIRELFRESPGFDKSLFERQVAVMLGQIQNLTTALEERYTPWHLMQMPVFVVKRQGPDQNKIRVFLKKSPFFKNC